MTLLLLLVVAAWSADLPDVVEEVRAGVSVNWTRLVVHADAGARGYGVGNTQQAVEQDVRAALGPAVLQGAREVRLDNRNAIGDLEVLDRPVWEQVRSRFDGWTVVEARYYTSGKVELTAELSLQELLKPWSLQRAVAAPDGRQPSYTGLLVDARGLPSTPAIAPRLIDADGRVLWDPQLWEAEALQVLPVAYVPDPAHPVATERVGTDPLIVVAERARGADLVLTADDTTRFRTGLRGARILGEGRVVVVVDP